MPRYIQASGSDISDNTHAPRHRAPVKESSQELMGYPDLEYSSVPAGPHQGQAMPNRCQRAVLHCWKSFF